MTVEDRHLDRMNCAFSSLEAAFLFVCVFLRGMCLVDSVSWKGLVWLFAPNQSSDWTG